LSEGVHYDVKLSREEWIKLVTWIDCGAPYYGSYYGRRNLAYRGAPDFRPVPTLESACGIPPDFPELSKPEPLPAELLVWWPLNEADDGTARDASDERHNGRISPAARIGDEAGKRALQLDGNAFVAGDGLGSPEALSISLWLKPLTMPNRWNPLLFSDGGQPGAFHFSLRDDGTPNVAVNRGPGTWTHRPAATALTADRWYHLVVTCDPRYGGKIAFYLDGKRDSQRGLSLGVPLDLSSFRLGAWNNWEENPRAGFDGLLDEVRIYRGILDETQVANLFTAGR
jgi:hypothetical protein